jgi:hypothetical protein
VRHVVSRCSRALQVPDFEITCCAMKSKVLFGAAAVSVLLGLGSLIAGWNGTVGLTLSSSLAGCFFHMEGKATGGWAIAGIGGIVLAMLFLIAAIIRLIARAASHKP